MTNRLALNLQELKNKFLLLMNGLVTWKKKCSFIPEIGVISQTEQSLLERKHNPFGHIEGVVDLQGVRFLPSNVFLPKVNLKKDANGV